MKALIWLIGLFWPALAAAVERFFEKKQEQVDAQVQEITQHEQQIDAQAEADKSGVDDMSDPDVDSRLRW